MAASAVRNNAPTFPGFSGASVTNINGFFEPIVNGGWGLYSNVGQVYNAFSKSEAETYTVNVSSGFDLVPGGSDKGKHNIQFGFMYEQRVRRAWSINPVSEFGLCDQVEIGIQIKNVKPALLIDIGAEWFSLLV